MGVIRRHFILCIVDDATALEVRTLALEHNGYLVLGASSATEGMALFWTHPVELVLLDRQPSHTYRPAKPCLEWANQAALGEDETSRNGPPSHTRSSATVADPALPPWRVDISCFEGPSGRCTPAHTSVPCRCDTYSNGLADLDYRPHYLLEWV